MTSEQMCENFLCFLEKTEITPTFLRFINLAKGGVIFRYKCSNLELQRLVKICLCQLADMRNMRSLTPDILTTFYNC